MLKTWQASFLSVKLVACRIYISAQFHDRFDFVSGVVINCWIRIDSMTENGPSRYSTAEFEAI